MTGPLAILVFAEDTGKDAHATLRRLVEAMLHHIDPLLDARRLSFERGAPFHDFYKSARPDDHRRKLVLARAIATHLAIRGQPTLVVVHVDADRRWSERDDPHLCDNLRRFHAEIVAHVATILSVPSHQLDRLLFLVPFWSIESWLFHDTRDALAICHECHPRYQKAVEKFEAWRDEPHLLDEQARPKDVIPLGSKYNLRLAEGLSARRLDAHSPSFAHAVAAARRSGLVELLPSLRHGAAP